ncbi:unnamed protein product [Blepharisma stoltei]|uniref:HTH CENPB-type domain-containing protein n=1 Tax=Blepharisma stoltei TaxID=1481888 RepID=A0AAU9IDJ7_9CILI|nr:unnamed protein product [Blepharisma stoltei]
MDLSSGDTESTAKSESPSIKPEKTTASSYPRIRREFTLEEKKDIIEQFHRSKISITNLAKVYHVRRQAVTEILKDKNQILYANGYPEYFNIDLPKKESSSYHPILVKALSLWINQWYSYGLPIKYKSISEKAQFFYGKLAGVNPPKKDLIASPNWVRHFKERYNFKHIGNVDKPFQPDKESAECFIKKFKEFIWDKGYSPEQIYNCDEIKLNWRKIPKKLISNPLQREINSEQIKILLCCNATGTHKLRLLVVGNDPIEGDLPAIYEFNNQTAITSITFENWIYDHFIPETKAFLAASNLPQHALLLYDCSIAHNMIDTPRHHYLRTMAFPINSTHSLQPLCQSIIPAFKYIYKLRFLQKLIDNYTGTKQSVFDFTEIYDLRECMHAINETWHEISEDLIKNDWKILGFHIDFKYSDPQNELNEIIYKCRYALDLDEQELKEFLEENIYQNNNENLLSDLEIMKQAVDEEEAKEIDTKLAKNGIWRDDTINSIKVMIKYVLQENLGSVSFIDEAKNMLDKLENKYKNYKEQIIADNDDPIAKKDVS